MLGCNQHARFSNEEDLQLTRLVAEYGTDDWAAIAKKMGRRSARQCRERWKHYLSTSTSHGPWTLREEELLVKHFLEIGPKWTRLATILGNRTDQQVKTRLMLIMHARQAVNRGPQRKCRLVLPEDEMAVPVVVDTYLESAEWTSEGEPMPHEFCEPF
jgi:hypothetical protein